LVVNEQTTLSRQSSKGNWRRRMMISLVKRFYPWADGIVAVSDGVAEDISQFAGIRRERIQTIFNPIIRGELKELAKAEVKDPWLSASHEPLILAVGRLSEAKDFPTLLRAVAEARKVRPVRLLILGEGRDRPMLEALISELNLKEAVHMPGFVANPYAYMKYASLFVLSSIREGLPTVLIEALYCGVPVVATDCPTGPREILRNGELGRLVPMQDVPSLAEASVESFGAKPPSPETCQPYEVNTVVKGYLNLLMSN
jgi:glycosyltransferase involved in cell wall biosynthesis